MNTKGVQGAAVQYPLISQEDLPQKRILTYMPSIFVICPLPARSTKSDVKTYERRYNNFNLRLVGGNGIPGGKIGRDMLMLFATGAVMSNAQEVNMRFDSLNDFARSMGMGINHNDKLIEQLEKYSATYIYFEQTVHQPFDKNNKQRQLSYVDAGVIQQMPISKGIMRIERVVNIPFIKQINKIGVIREGMKRCEPVCFDVQLSDDFTQMVKRNAVPVDYKIYRDMDSTLMKDLYVWLAYRNNGSIDSDGCFVPRQSLIKQFGEDEMKGERKKYERILQYVEKIKAECYPALRYEIIATGPSERKGLVLYKSPLVIKPNDTRYVPLLSLSHP